jgi:hypothetical protein
MGVDTDVPRLGIVEGMDPALYHAINACSASRLHNLTSRSAAYVKWESENERPQTEALLRGIYVHAAILEPETVESRFVVLGRCEAETKNGRCGNQGSVLVGGSSFCRVRGHAPATADPNPDQRQPVPQDLYDECRAIRDSVLSHPVASALLTRNAKREVSLFWIDKATSLPCKARPDLLFGNGIGDVKVTRNAKPGRFPGECANRGHHMRAAFYLSGAREVADHAKRYLFIAVEPDAPYECCVYELHPDALELGAEEAAQAMARYAACMKSGVWPGYSTEPQMVMLPAWYMAREEEPVVLTSGGEAI